MSDYVGGWWVGPRWVGRTIARWMLELHVHAARDYMPSALEDQAARYALTDARDEARKLNMDKFGRTCCPCGYVEECAFWCGNGHETGSCSSEICARRARHRAEQDKITEQGRLERERAAMHADAGFDREHNLVGTVQIQGYQNQNFYCSCGTHWPGPVAYHRHIENSAVEIWSEEH